MLFKDNIINFTSLLFSVHIKKNNNSKDSYVNFPVTYFFLFTRKIKKIRREKGKLRHKMDMKMIIPGDRHDFSDDIGLFNLGKIKNKAVCI